MVSAVAGANINCFWIIAGSYSLRCRLLPNPGLKNWYAEEVTVPAPL
jgi:hypothetical protein